MLRIPLQGLPVAKQAGAMSQLQQKRLWSFLGLGTAIFIAEDAVCSHCHPEVAERLRIKIVDLGSSSRYLADN